MLSKAEGAARGRKESPLQVTAVLAFMAAVCVALLSVAYATPISPAHADGLVAYQENTLNSPRYRLWNSTDALSAELTDANLTTGDIAWVVTRAGHERDEAMVTTLNDQSDVHVQVYNVAAGAWGNLLAASTATNGFATRAYDLAYEDISGDALILYENSNAATNAAVAYRVWNGTGYSAEALFTTGLANSPIQWVSLVSKPGTDDIMALVHNNANDLYAVAWNGTAFDTSRSVTASTGTTSNTEEHFSFSWEGRSGDGLLVYGEGNSIIYRLYDPDDPLQNYWGAATTLSAIGNGLDAARTCSDPVSDHIGIIWQDAGNDVNARMWNGTHILASPPTEDAVTEPGGANNINVDCAWPASGGTALFGFVDNNALSMDYFNFTVATDAWSTADLTTAASTANFGANDITSLRLVEHPTTDEIMVTAMDIDEEITMHRWTGSAFSAVSASPIETNSDVLNGAQEGVMFDWHRYDPLPNVTGLAPGDGAAVNYSNTVNITALVRDNIAVSAVLVNVTLPNGTARLLSLSDADADGLYNATFSETASLGNYTLVVLANDTGRHRNINATTRATFTVVDLVPPAWSDALNVTPNTFSASAQLNLSVNWSDAFGVASVLMEVNRSGATANHSASNSTGPLTWNLTLSGIPAGTHSWRSIALDTSNNTNATPWWGFAIAKAASSLILTLDGSQSNITVEGGDAVWLNGSLAAGDAGASLVLSVDGETTGQGASVANLTAFPALGDINVSLNYTATQNYTASMVSYLVTVVDTTAPEVAGLGPVAGTGYLNGSVVTLEAAVTDNIAVASVWANVSWENGSQLVSLQPATLPVYSGNFTNTSGTGIYNVTFFANDTSALLNDTESTWFNVTQAPDVTPPVWSGLSASPATPATYAESAVHLFNVTWTDTSALDERLIEHNFTGTLENFSVSSAGAGRYFYSQQSLAAGSYAWRMLANDTSGNGNATPLSDYVVQEATPVLTLANSTPAEVSYGNVTNITCASSSPQAAPALYRNGTAVANPESALLAAGLWVYTCNTSASQNFTEGSAGPLNVTVGKAASALNLTINGTAAGISVEVGSLLWLNGSLLTGDPGSALLLYVNGTPISQEASVANLTGFPSLGEFNVSLNYTATQNHTASRVSYLVTVNDTTAPSIALAAPAAQHNASGGMLIFNFTATDNHAQEMSCSLVLDSVVNSTNASAQNGTWTAAAVSGIAEGAHSWYVNCTDPSGNVNTSGSRAFTVDTSAPAFVSLTTDPADADGLDPNTNITVIANVTENVTEVHTVILQERLSSESAFTNITMALNSTTGLFQATFNASSSGVYFMRLVANDTLGHEATSNLANITVEYERSWTLTPTALTPVVAAAAGQNITLGNLTIGNTGDFGLNFTLSSDSASTLFNQSANFSLDAGATITIEVNDSATEQPTKSILLTVNASPDAEPASRNATATIVTALGQPILVATFIVPASETLTVTQGDEGVSFLARLENAGDGNASNVSLAIALPSAWGVRFDPTGMLRLDLDELLAGDEAELLIEADIPSNATAGTFLVTANTTGQNESGGNLTQAGLVFGDAVTVTVQELTVLGTPSPTVGENEEAAPPASGGSGYPLTSLVSAVERILAGEELLNTSERLELVRGMNRTFPVTVRNVFEATLLVNVTLEVEGYLSQYLSSSPALISSIPFDGQESFLLTVLSPEYMEQGTHELTVTISGTLVARGLLKQLTERRKVTLVIHTLSEEEAVELLGAASAEAASLEEAGIESARARALLAEAEGLIAAHEFDAAKDVLAEVSSLKGDALAARNLISGLEGSIGQTDARLSWLLGRRPDRFTRTKELLNLALAAFEREDYAAALERAGEARLALALETQGFASLFFLLDSWPALALGVLSSAVVAILGYRRLLSGRLRARIRALDAEEENVLRLMREAQQAYFAERRIGPDSYSETMEQHRRRLAEMRQQRTRLRSKRVVHFSHKSLLKDLEGERSAVTGHLKRLQEEYFRKMSIPKESYDEQSEAYLRRLAEIEGEIWSMQL